MRPQGNQAAKQKLAEFKEQMKKTLNMPGSPENSPQRSKHESADPGAQRKPAPKPMGAKPSGLLNTKPGQPSSAGILEIFMCIELFSPHCKLVHLESGVRQVQGGASVRPTQPAVKSQVLFLLCPSAPFDGSLGGSWCATSK